MRFLANRKSSFMGSNQFESGPFYYTGYPPQ